MTYDYYQSLRDQRNCSNPVNTSGLASGFVDECTVWSCQDKLQNQKADPKNDARQCYIERVKQLKSLNLPDGICKPDFSCLPDSSWLGITVRFTLQTPWYSKDDRLFHVLDNPVRKDRVFGVPFMSASSWKGMLCWACRMQEGLSDYLKTHDMKIDGWKDPNWILHLFGNEQGETESKSLKSGALVFYPTWFDKVGFEVINPHSRKTKAGTIPIYYEVVPSGTKGDLQLIYAPFPSQVERDEIKVKEVMEKLIDAINDLLNKYGISAKRTVGWGTAKTGTWSGFMKMEKKSATNETKPKKKILKGLSALGDLLEKSEQKAAFDATTAEDFKKRIKEYFSVKGGGR